MDLVPMLNEIFQLCIVPLLGILTAYLVKFLKEKIGEASVNVENEKLSRYLLLIRETVISCVIATNQTYVDALKDTNAFDKAAQKEAFKKTYEAVMKILSDDVKSYMDIAIGDLEEYIRNLIEENVNNLKNF